MYKILVILAVIPCLLGARPSIKNALRHKVVIDFKDAIVPIISKHVEHLTLPDVHTHHSGFTIDVTQIHIDIKPFHPNQISIGFKTGTSALEFGATNFAMKGAAHIHVKWMFISKSMGADVEVSNLGMQCQITMISHDGKPNIKVDHLHMSLHADHVHIHLHGDIIVKIIEFIANLLKGHFVGEIVKQLDSKLPPALTTEVNKRLNTLPSDIPIWGNYNMKYSFPYSPFVRQDYLFTGINAYIHPKGKPNPPPYEPPEMPEFDSSVQKGIQFFLSDYVVKSAIDASFSIGMFFIAFEKDMLGHHIKMTCKATKSPVFAFVNAIDVLLDAECTVDFDNDPKNRFIIEAQMHVNMKEYVKQAVIFFSVTEVKFTKIEYKQPNPVNIEWFKNGINTVLEVIKQIVNSDLGQRGIPLPAMHEVDYTDTGEVIKTGYMVIGTNPVFHFKLADPE